MDTTIIINLIIDVHLFYYRPIFYKPFTIVSHRIYLDYRRDAPPFQNTNKLKTNQCALLFRSIYFVAYSPIKMACFRYNSTSNAQPSYCAVQSICRTSDNKNYFPSIVPNPDARSVFDRRSKQNGRKSENRVNNFYEYLSSSVFEFLFPPYCHISVVVVCMIYGIWASVGNRMYVVSIYKLGKKDTCDLRHTHDGLQLLALSQGIESGRRAHPSSYYTTHRHCQALDMLASLAKRLST